MRTVPTANRIYKAGAIKNPISKLTGLSVRCSNNEQDN